MVWSVIIVKPCGLLLVIQYLYVYALSVQMLYGIKCCSRGKILFFMCFISLAKADSSDKKRTWHNVQSANWSECTVRLAMLSVQAIQSFGI